MQVNIPVKIKNAHRANKNALRIMRKPQGVVVESQDMFVDEPLKNISSISVLKDLASGPELPKDYYIDWVKIIMQLEREGQNMPKIAKRTGIPECRIKGWKLQGYRVRLEDGLPVIKLWLAITSKQISELPIAFKYDPRARVSGV